MRIICLVPSITETLLACDINLVGRSRFCIHPSEQVVKITKVGGTKDIDWLKTTELKPDLVILDKEENTLAMAESCPYNYFALHITCIQDVAPELARLANKLNNTKLKEFAKRWQQVTKQPLDFDLPNLPGVIEWWQRPTKALQFIYLIWQEPWMAIGERTFIQSVLDHIGVKSQRIPFSEKYPSIDLSEFSQTKTCLLFSSEPFPFERHRRQLEKLGYACALIDGEKYSWYGIRSLEFLENLTETGKPNSVS